MAGNSFRPNGSHLSLAGHVDIHLLHALDVAKAIALMAVHTGDVLEYAWDHPQVRPIEHDLPHFVALPTTAGTGSEVGRSSVISDDKTHIKKIIFSPRLLAKAVFADPELTLDLPPHITAATGAGSRALKG